MSVHVYVCVRKIFMKKVKSDKKEMRREKKRERDSNLFIQINKYTDRQTDRQTNRHKSFIDMRYNTNKHDKSNSIKRNRIVTNRIQ